MCRPVLACAAVIVLGNLTFAQAQPEPTPRLIDRGSPGVLVRLYQIDEIVHAVPELRPGQLPNVARVVRVIDLETEGFAPLTDRFVTCVDGFLTVRVAGEYGLRLISDDGAKLWINDQLVIDHDGPHGATPKDARLHLEAGVHPLRIRHFEGGGAERLALLWRAPTDDAKKKFVPVPPSALTHDPTDSTETAPGSKHVIRPLRRGRPGDGSPVAGTHPSLKKVTRLEARAHGIAEFSGVAAPMVAGLAGPAPYVWIPVEVPPDALTPLTLAGESEYLIGHPRQGTLYRVFGDGDIVDGQRSQGCAFRFSRGHSSDFNHIVWALERGLLLIDSDDGQASLAEELTAHTPAEILHYSGKAAFEMKAVRVMSNGLEITFTKPLDSRVGWDPESYLVEQWRFEQEDGVWTPPRRDGIAYEVKSASVAEDRTKVFLEMDDLKPSHVVYIRLLPPCISEAGELPWTTEAWYTLNSIPAGRRGQVLDPPRPEPQNRLTEAERAAGWQLLFDGKTAEGWRGYRKDEFPRGWAVKNGALVRVGPGGDIATTDEFTDFELRLQWRISPCGNSGIFFRVAEEEGWPWETGPEMQVLDNTCHKDGQSTRTSAGADYALHAPVRDVTRPVGFFNDVRIQVVGDHVTYWLNDVKIVEYELGSAEWKQRVANSKFANMPRFGQVRAGHIVLQDHGDKVWYRNIKIREIADADESSN